MATEGDDPILESRSVMGSWGGAGGLAGGGAVDEGGGDLPDEGDGGVERGGEGAGALILNFETGLDAHFLKSVWPGDF